jgi:predicted HD superfamily hydrolase involved in NAD metabolism
MNMPISYHSSTGLEEQVKNRFKEANLAQEYTRAMLVRSQALELASHYGLDPKQVSAAALLLNISHLIPEQDYLKLAEEYGAEILPEERQNPHLLHQKISRILAVEEFNISDKEVLNAIACHTTLRPSATLLDKIIFIASKQNGNDAKDMIFKNKKKIASEQDLNKSAFSYLFNEINNQVAIIHPLAQKALDDLMPKK